MPKVDERILLVVDDELSVCRAVTRMLRGRVGEVLVAENSLEAEAILSTRPVTHLLCDHGLGDGRPTGVDLIARWRGRYPGIARAVILTGLDIETIPVDPAVDGVLTKAAEPDEIVRVLEL